MAEGQFKLRVAYSKQGRLRFLGHLEFLRTQDRCIRRSGLPFAVTQGFKPHMRIAFTGALPLGTASLAEYYDLVLNEYVDAEEALSRLRDATPAELLPYAAGYVDMREPSLEAWLNRSVWELSVAKLDIDFDVLAASLQNIVRVGTINYLRGKKQKTVTLSDTLIGYELTKNDKSPFQQTYPWLLRMQTKSGPEGSLRPQLFLSQGLEQAGWQGNIDAIIYPLRTALAHENDDGTLIDAFSACSGKIAQKA